MSPFWSSLFAEIKDCGRNATWFLVTLGAMTVVLLLVVVMGEIDLFKYIVPTVSIAAVFALVWACMTIRRWRTRHHGPWRYTPLSKDELRVARSKLTRDRIVRNP
jgi:membrane protein YdbS with pleckstrin-like domain